MNKKKNRIVFLDGAMGTRLASDGISPSPMVNLTNPQKVVEIHKEYINAGADIIETNTF